jgi:predicted house-cleaning noncanonical NTP pyrophosphatase (MazG superfamily)
MKAILNTIVRDNVPQMIEERGKKCEYRLLEKEEFKEELLNKLKNEVNELINNPEEKEIADIYEVLESIITQYGFEPMHIDYLKLQKKEINGEYSKGVFLVSVEED